MTPLIQKTVGVLATQAVETYLQKVERYEPAVLQDQDPEDLHQMRVNLRRLRTVMQVFAPAIALPKAGREPRVAQVARVLGRLRDLDVITDTVQTHYLPDLPDNERRHLKPVFKYLAKNRKKAYRKTRAVLQGKRYAALKRSLHAWVLDPDGNDLARLDIDQVLPDLTLPLVSRLWLHPGWLVATHLSHPVPQPQANLTPEAIATLVTGHSETLHHLRKQVKRVRYQLKLVSEYYGDRLRADLNDLATLQDALGALQDSWVMAAFLQRALPHWQQQMPTLKALITASRQQAWQTWQALQTQYLDPQRRTALGQILLQPGPEAPPVDNDRADAAALSATEDSPETA